LKSASGARRAGDPWWPEHRLQDFLKGLPIQGAIQPFQKIIRRRGGHQTIKQSHLCVGRRLHASLTHFQIIRSNEFCRGLKL